MNVTNTLEILYNLQVDMEMIRAFNSVNKFIILLGHIRSTLIMLRKHSDKFHSR